MPIHATLASLDGRTLLALGDPHAGKSRLVQRAIDRVASGDRAALHVTASRCHERLGSVPSGVRVVDCSPGPTPPAPYVDDVSAPNDLTGIAMPVSRFLDDASDPFVVVDSVSTLLRYADEGTVFKFLGVLTAQMWSADATGVFLLDRGSHDPQSVSTLQQLFDGRLDVEPTRARIRGVGGVDDDWRVR